MKQLKIILQSNWFLIFLTLFTLSLILKENLIETKSKYLGNETEFIGQIINYKVKDNYYIITLKGKEKLIVYLDNFNYNLGDTIYLKGKLEIPNRNTTLNEFNYREYLKREKINYILEASDTKLVKKNNNILYKIKNQLLIYMDTFESKNYLKSFILGDTSYLGKKVYNSFQDNGICHILSIGSTHITFLSIFLYAILKKLKIKKSFSQSIILIIIFFYLLLTDFNVPILRVYLYMIISNLNKRFKLNFKQVKIFYLTTLITLIFNPNFLYHKGFLYSYIISFLLIFCKNLLTGNYFQKLFKISFLSFLGSFPLNIYFNYKVNLLSILYNFLYVPIFSIIIFPLTFLTLFFKFFDKVLVFLMETLINLSYFLNNLNFLSLIFKKPSILILIFYFIIIIFIIIKHSKTSIIILILTLIVHFNINYIFPYNFFMIQDVGQGDSLLISLNNKVILIDTGGLYQKEISEKIVQVLYSLGISRIDYLILSHGDYDHMGEASNLIEKIKISNVVFNNGNYNELELKLIEKLLQKKIKYYKGLKEINFTNYKLEFLNTGIYDNENDNSSVIYFTYNDYKFLLMGDASSKKELDILKKYAIVDIDFFKVGHHGSTTSSNENFIETIKPKNSFISVGKNNLYGHPKQEVLDILHDSKIYRTDLDGSILVNFKSKNYEIVTFPP